MADELISRQAAHNMMVHLQRYVWDSPISNERHVTVDADEVNFGLDKLPAVDAVPVVRCKDCKHKITTVHSTAYGTFVSCEIFRGVRHGLDDFCSYGERREDA